MTGRRGSTGRHPRRGVEAAERRAATNLPAYVRRLEALADREDTAINALRMLIELGLRHEAAQPASAEGSLSILDTPTLAERARRLVTLLEQLEHADDAEEARRLSALVDELVAAPAALAAPVEVLAAPSAGGTAAPAAPPQAVTDAEIIPAPPTVRPPRPAAPPPAPTGRDEEPTAQEDEEIDIDVVRSRFALADLIERRR